MVDLVATLHREPADDEGTPGVLVAEGRAWNTLELPWRENRRKLSRIPAGRYRCVWVRSPRFGWVYHVTQVPDRSAVLIHGGNLAGDVMRGFKTHVQGCILLGERRGRLGGQKAVLVSQPALRRFHTIMGQRPFFLEMLDA
jgi:hypothetical protein